VERVSSPSGLRGSGEHRICWGKRLFARLCAQPAIRSFLAEPTKIAEGDLVVLHE